MKWNHTFGKYLRGIVSKRRPAMMVLGIQSDGVRSEFQRVLTKAQAKKLRAFMDRL